MSVYIIPLLKQGTNSTMFTECCRCAINDNQKNCPVCEKPVIGHDEPSEHKRGLLRWLNATRNWSRP